MAFNEETGKIWFNGEFVNWKDANIHVLSHVCGNTLKDYLIQGKSTGWTSHIL